MKKLLASVLSTILAVTLVACGSTAEVDTAAVVDAVVEAVEETAVVEEVETVERTTFTVGFDAAFPPYGYMDDNGSYVGFDLDLAEEVAARNGWELIKQPIDWDAKDMELSSGTIDCIWNGFSVTPEREDQYAWSMTYIDNQQVMVVSADSGITTLEEISGLNVAVQAGSAALEALNADDCADWTASFATLSEVTDYNTAFMNLEAGAAEAVAVDIAVAEYQLSIREEGAFVIIEEAFYSEPYAIGFRVEDTELRDIIDAEYMKLVEDGTYEALAVEFGIDTAMLALLD